MVEKAFFFLVLYLRVGFRWIKDFNSKGDILKLIKEYVEDYFCDLSYGKIF